VIYFWAPWWQLWRSILFYYFIYASVWMIGWRLLVWRWISKAVPLIRCVLVGDKDDEYYAKELESHPWIRFQVAKEVSEPALNSSPAALFELCQEVGANSVITGPDISARLVPQLLYCKGRGIDVQRLISIFMATTGRIPVAYIRPDDIAFGPSFSLRTSRLHRTVHRILDLSVSSLLLVLSFPLQLVAIIAVAIETGRPVFYKQDRVGQDETEFEVLKIRTMIKNAEQKNPQWSTQDDPRVTRVGRFLRRTRVDELPQLFSVLKGDMSFIGPRPERRFFVDQLNQSVPYYSLRHSVRPGLTGWAQVNHGYGSSTDDARRKLEFDLYYIQESSFLLDCIILLRTIRTVISRPGS
jgi:exopolysaccharide biosynthesis polyprenyl glycosylphosphotransferase